MANDPKQAGPLGGGGGGRAMGASAPPPPTSLGSPLIEKKIIKINQ